MVKPIEFQQILQSQKASQFCGLAHIPGDKSISHRALILGSLAVGETKIHGLLESEDVLQTLRALRMFGADIARHEDGTWRVYGVGTGGFKEPSDVIDCGNSGTGARLLMGAMSTTPITAVFTGDASLRSRPMRRVTKPLSEFGAQLKARGNERLPVTVMGTDQPLPIVYRMKTQSAQVKSAILLAGLNAPGQTRVIESAETRDHTERMLKSFGADIAVEKQGGEQIITLDGYAELSPQSVTIPGDPSSAAFVIAAALIVKDSNIRMTDIGMNPTRCGFLTTVQDMGASVNITERHVVAGEPVANLQITYAPLKGVVVPAERAVTMIDEYPILAALAACAQGDTVMQGIGELRFKESDRIQAMVAGLNQCGVKTTESEDQLIVHGRGTNSVSGGATCQSFMDHRIAMSFLCLGLISKRPIVVDDVTPIQTSFPSFVSMMNGLGAQIYSPSE